MTICYLDFFSKDMQKENMSNSICGGCELYTSSLVLPNKPVLMVLTFGYSYFNKFVINDDVMVYKYMYI